VAGLTFHSNKTFAFQNIFRFWFLGFKQSEKLKIAKRKPIFAAY
jgi:hypothetical protein